MEIVWTVPAKLQLKAIVTFYSKLSFPASQKIKKRILEKPRVLQDYPRIGPIEENLAPLGKYRFLIESNWKIIYTIEKDIAMVLRFLIPEEILGKCRLKYAFFQSRILVLLKTETQDCFVASSSQRQWFGGLFT